MTWHGCWWLEFRCIGLITSCPRWVLVFPKKWKVYTKLSITEVSTLTQCLPPPLETCQNKTWDKLKSFRGQISWADISAYQDFYFSYQRFSISTKFQSFPTFNSESFPNKILSKVNRSLATCQGHKHWWPQQCYNGPFREGCQIENRSNLGHCPNRREGGPKEWPECPNP